MRIFFFRPGAYRPAVIANIAKSTLKYIENKRLGILYTCMFVLCKKYVFSNTCMRYKCDIFNENFATICNCMVQVLSKYEKDDI